MHFEKICMQKVHFKIQAELVSQGCLELHVKLFKKLVFDKFSLFFLQFSLPLDHMKEKIS